MEIKLKKQEYTLRYSLRGLFVFERITGKSYKADGLLEDYILLYSFLLASNPESFNMDFEEFISLCDEDKSIYPAFKKWFVSELRIQMQFFDESKSSENLKRDDDSKKKSRHRNSTE